MDDLFKNTKSASVSNVVNALFAKPIFSSSDIIQTSEVTPKTGRRLLDTLKNLDYIYEIRSAKGRRPSIYIFPRLLNITDPTKIL